MKLILASASPRRLELLAQIGVIPWKIIKIDADECALKGESPRLTALRLSQLKASSYALQTDEIVLAADTVVALGAREMPKAEIAKQVQDCLKMLQGRSHRVYTGVTIATRAKSISRVIETRVTFKTLSNEEIDAYVKSCEGEGKAGGYAIQGKAASFVTKISGSYSNIVGLPLYEVSQMLHGLGFPPFKSWQQ